MARTVPRWALVPATLAPISLIGGWTAAAALREDGFSSVTDTISALAASDAPHRWLMTTAFVVVGACHVATASALYPASRAGRVALAVGGMCAWGVAAFPLPSQAGDTHSTGHFLFAAASFLAMSIWPFLASGRTPWNRSAGAVVSAVLLAELGWFVVALRTGSATGLAERVAAGTQAFVPLLAVVVWRSTSTNLRMS